MNIFLLFAYRNCIHFQMISIFLHLSLSEIWSIPIIETMTSKKNGSFMQYMRIARGGAHTHAQQVYLAGRETLTPRCHAIVLVSESVYSSYFVSAKSCTDTTFFG